MLLGEPPVEAFCLRSASCFFDMARDCRIGSVWMASLVYHGLARRT